VNDVVISSSPDTVLSKQAGKCELNQLCTTFEENVTTYDVSLVVSGTGKEELSSSSEKDVDSVPFGPREHATDSIEELSNN
jgi:ABC-type tungstate transport system permease subunit